MTFGTAYIFASIPYLSQQKNILTVIFPLALGLICVVIGGFKLLNSKYTDDEDMFYLVQANKWVDVQINKIKL